MSKSHLTTAHNYGVQKALEKCGYSSIAEVEKEAKELGLDQPQPQQKTAEPNIDAAMASLRAKLG